MIYPKDYSPNCLAVIRWCNHRTMVQHNSMAVTIGHLAKGNFSSSYDGAEHGNTMVQHNTMPRDVNQIPKLFGFLGSNTMVQNIWSMHHLAKVPKDYPTIWANIDLCLIRDHLWGIFGAFRIGHLALMAGLPFLSLDSFFGCMVYT